MSLFMFLFSIGGSLLILVVAILYTNFRYHTCDRNILYFGTHSIAGTILMSTGFILDPAAWILLNYGAPAMLATISCEFRSPSSISQHLIQGAFPGTAAGAVAAFPLSPVNKV
jgi:hypothetical protein